MQRRAFVNTLLTALAGSTLSAQTRRHPRILVRSSWQTVNIGDIAHTPGLLSILETHLPQAELHLWPSKLDNGVDALLLARFPQLKIAHDPQALKRAFDDCDFLLHSSGASFVAQKHVERWHTETGKPYGVYGITLAPQNSSSTTPTSQASLTRTIEVLSGARFVYFRDSKSLAFAKGLGCAAPVMEFGPDAAFACDLRDNSRANAFLKSQRLEPGKFLCCIPRLRFTPYWTIPSKSRAFDPVKHARNEEMKEQDHAPLRQAIRDIVEQTDLKILICPEDETQMQVGKEMLLDKLSAKIRKRVAWRPNYWLTGEAISVYTQSVGLFGNEMHSPIMCIGHGIPAIVCRWAEQTSKGFMWEDIGLGNWLFDMDDPAQRARVAPTVLEMALHPDQSREKAESARQFVRTRQRATMSQLSSELV